MKNENAKGDSTSLMIAIGAIIANLIGSGFATGQEILQHAGVFGFGGIVGLAIVFVLFVTCAATIMVDTKKKGLLETRDLFKFYCGKYLAVFLTWSIPFIMFTFYIVMLSGAGATLNQYYGLPQAVGRLLMAFLTVLTVLFGLKKTVDIIGHIGPALILLVLFIALYACFSKGGVSFSEGSEIIRRSTDIYRAGPTNWWCGILYSSELLVTGIIFYAKLGPTMKSARTGAIAALVGCGSYVLVGMILCLAFMKNVNAIVGTDVPMLVLANNISPIMGTFFSVILLLGIYTTAAPMLWIAVNALAKDGTRKAWITTVVLGCVSLAISFLPYQRLVNIVWPLSGYLGFAAMLGVLWSLVLRKLRPTEEAQIVGDSTVTIIEKNHGDIIS